MPRPVRVVAALLAVAGLIGAAVVWRVSRPTRSVVAHFTSVVGIAVGSDVRVLGIRVGEVTGVVPEGATVRVEMTYDPQWSVPAGARAVIVPPSIVSDRYVQLTPAYTGGPALPDRADIPVDRTAVPLEVDDVYRALDELNRALGPTGANADGALSTLVKTARANLEGNGGQLHDTLAGLDRALSTVADGRADLYGTVKNLADLAGALSRSDAQVREFNQRLADVAEQLAAERDELAAAVRTLATALADIRGFVHDNRAALVSNVEALTDITGVLVRQQKALMEVLDVAPLTLANLNLAYNATSGTLDTRDNVMGPYDPAAYACSLMVDVVPLAQIPKTCFDLATLLLQRGLPLTDQLRKLLGLAPGGTPVSPTLPGGTTTLVPGVTGGVVDTLDQTLGGILRGGK